jgi:hypothetical protein
MGIFFTPVSVLVIADLIHREAALGGDLFERDASFRILLKVFPRGGDSATVFFGQRLLFLGIHHYPEELKDAAI